MDLIAAHRHGLADQLSTEAAGLSGRAHDGVQRAIVLHHLYDASGGRHAYALLAAEGALALDPALAAMRRAARRGWWKLGASKREALLGRIDRFAHALRTIERARCEAMWVAYRAAQNEATGALVPVELDALRGGADPRTLFLSHVAWVEGEWGLALEAALADLAWPLAPAAVRAALSTIRISLERLDSAGKAGLRRTERALLADKRLPEGFAANPAQHYYKLQRTIAARRRQEQAKLDGIPVEETVRLAAAA